MGLTERHWFENEDVPENYEWALEDAVYNSRTSKKPEDSALTGRGGMMMADRDSVINDLNVAKRILCNPQMLTPEMCVRIGQSVTNALALIREQQEQLKAQKEVLDALRKVGYPHDFQREKPWISNYMWAITDVVKKAVRLNNKIIEPPCDEPPKEEDDDQV